MRANFAAAVQVRLKEHGSELIEVADNGCGVRPDNYQALTLKYHTSKLRGFADLQAPAFCATLCSSFPSSHLLSPGPCRT